MSFARYRPNRPRHLSSGGSVLLVAQRDLIGIVLAAVALTGPWKAREQPGTIRQRWNSLFIASGYGRLRVGSG
jgi:hypothetical protein